MEIRMKTISSGPDGQMFPGKKYNVPDEVASALVKGDYAEFADIRPPEKAVIAPQETAVAGPEEVASEGEPPARNRGGRPRGGAR